MLLSLTWNNIILLMGVLTTVLSALVVISFFSVQRRIDSIQHQLTDRLTIYHRDMLKIEARLDRLERD